MNLIRFPATVLAAGMLLASAQTAAQAGGMHGTTNPSGSARTAGNGISGNAKTLHGTTTAPQNLSSSGGSSNGSSSGTSGGSSGGGGSGSSSGSTSPTTGAGMQPPPPIQAMPPPVPAAPLPAQALPPPQAPAPLPAPPPPTQSRPASSGG